MNQLLASPHESMEVIVGKLMSGEMKLSYSSLSAFKESPTKFVEYKFRQKVTTPAMIFGSMVHCLILEPEDFGNRYFTFDDSAKCQEIGGDKPRATKAYKEWKATKLGEAGEREVVDPQDYVSAKIIADNVKNNRAAAKVLRLCPIHEKPIEWEYKNFKFHGFIDGDGEEIMFDLKIMADASPAKVQREIISRGLHIQSAMYIYGGAKVKKYYIIAADREGGISVHQIHENLLELGMQEYDRLVVKFNECILSESWSQSYDFYSERFDGIYIADKPHWL